MIGDLIKREKFRENHIGRISREQEDGHLQAKERGLLTPGFGLS